MGCLFLFPHCSERNSCVFNDLLSGTALRGFFCVCFPSFFFGGGCSWLALCHCRAHLGGLRLASPQWWNPALASESPRFQAKCTLSSGLKLFQYTTCLLTVTRPQEGNSREGNFYYRTGFQGRRCQEAEPGQGCRLHCSMSGGLSRTSQL